MNKRGLVSLAVLVALIVPASARATDDPRAYGTLQALLGFQTWGGASVTSLENDPAYADLAEPSLQTGTTGGFYLSGFYTRLVAEWIHLGGYFSYQGTELTLHANGKQSATRPSGAQLSYSNTILDLSLGVCAKLTGRMVGSFWFGLELDFGPAFMVADGDHLSTGFRIFPRVTFDWLPWKLRGRFLAGVSVSFGLVMDAYGAGEIDLLQPGMTKPTASDFDFSAIRPVLLVGGTFGV